jgi:hypothetical protein
MTLLESLQAEGAQIAASTTTILETAPYFAQGALVVESADAVLGQLAAKLRAGATLTPAEIEEYAVLYASLGMLADPNIRAGFNIDLTQPAGQAKFSTILNDTGTNPAVTKEVGKVAIFNGKSRLEQVRNELRNFPTMKPTDQQLYVNSINKLRIAFERAKAQLAQRNLPAVDAQNILPA